MCLFTIIIAQNQDEFLEMVLVLCGAGKDGSGGHAAVHQSAKGHQSAQKKSYWQVSQVVELALQKLLKDLHCKLLQLLFGKDGTKIWSSFFLYYALE